MVNVEFVFLKDENGNQQVLEEVAKIIEKAATDEGYAHLAKYIEQGFDYLSRVGIPSGKKWLPFTTHKSDGTLLTFATIIKELKYHPPLMEFRINWRYTGYFRAIFFYEEDKKGDQTIFFTKALVKLDRNPPEFIRLIHESERMLVKYHKEGADNEC